MTTDSGANAPAATDDDEAAQRKRHAWATRGKINTYIQEMGWYALQRDEEIVRSLLGKGPGRSLDIPCGSGRFTELQKELDFDVVSADYSPTMLDEAVRKAPGRVLRADIFNPPFPDESFDVVLISRLMFHYADPLTIIRGIAPLLRPGGRIVFDTLNPLSLRRAASLASPGRQKDGATRLHFANPAELSRGIEGLGLEVRQRRTAYVIPTRAYRLLPRWMAWTLHGIEKVWPGPARILTFWQVVKPEAR
ncbi:MAG TPA: methyltransferase domain-containing protein [Tepidisphaeraceae bacterium]|nr:methyltransferase domain-containing protein [Tepidisphaeraceae bacterium]